MVVSIITVSYNSEGTIADSIRSVFSQTYPHIEHIVIDGASTDKTLEIVRSTPNNTSKIISEPDLGIYDAMNKGIKLATGDIIGILNSDDIFADDDVIRRVVEAFITSGKEIVYADVVFVNDSNLSKIVRHYSSKSFSPLLFRFGFQPAHPTFYTYRSNFNKFGYYRTDLKISGDFELLLRYIKVHKLSFRYINDIWVKMRTGGASTSSIKNKIRLNNEILQACTLNDVYSNLILIYSKYLIKWVGFIYKKQI